MKLFSCSTVIAFFFITIGLLISGYSANMEWKNKVYGYWTLADKSSTLEAKSEYINKFVSALEESELSDHGAVFFENIDNDTQLNLEALKTLQSRLEDIKAMSPSSFEYQQAIQQITGQEQGEANEMISVLKDAWFISNHPILYFGDLAIFFMIFPGLMLLAITFTDDL